MRTAKRFVIQMAVALLGVAAPLTTPAHAQEVEVSGPLAGAPAVIGLRVYREMRFQIQLHSTMTLQDEYSRAVMLGGQLMFHPTDWLGIGAWGGFSLLQIDTTLTDEVKSKGQTNERNVLSLPDAGSFDDQVGRLKWIAAPQVAFIPLRGKLGIFEKLFVDTDFYIAGGVAFVGVEERADVDSGAANTCTTGAGTTPAPLAGRIDCFLNGNDPAGVAAQDERVSRVAIAPTFGVGLSLYVADFGAITLEWRAIPFAWNTSGTDESGAGGGDFADGAIDDKDQLGHFNHMMSLGFSFYLPTKPGRTHSE